MRGKRKTQTMSYIKKNDIIKIRDYLEKEDLHVFLALFNFGLNTGLRISDYINLKFEDIINNEIELREKKTNKLKKIKLNKVCLECLESLKKYYIEKGQIAEGYLFKSAAHKYKFAIKDKAIGYTGVVFYFNLLQKELNIPYNLGSHSLRKTWGRTVYYASKDLALLMNMFNHSHPSITLRYICVEQTTFDQVFMKTII